MSDMPSSVMLTSPTLPLLSSSVDQSKDESIDAEKEKEIKFKSEEEESLVLPQIKSAYKSLSTSLKPYTQSKTLIYIYIYIFQLVVNLTATHMYH